MERPGKDGSSTRVPEGTTRTCLIKARTGRHYNLPMGNIDLIQLWQEHTKHEFSTRDTEATLGTMVEDAYVNHVPVLTGGYGKTAQRAFYSRDFMPKMPPDTTTKEA